MGNAQEVEESLARFTLAVQLHELSKEPLSGQCEKNDDLVTTVEKLAEVDVSKRCAWWYVNLGHGYRVRFPEPIA